MLNVNIGCKPLMNKCLLYKCYLIAQCKQLSDMGLFLLIDEIKTFPPYIFPIHLCFNYYGKMESGFSKQFVFYFIS